MRESFRPDLKPDSRSLSRNLLFCFDGTWNDPSDDNEPGSDHTNVYKKAIAAGYLEDDLPQHDPTQLVFYYKGVGTGGDVDKIVGGITGKGAKQIRNKAFVQLVRAYKTGDKVFITGFSRGAAIARMFAQLIHKKGIPEEIEFNPKKGNFDTKGRTIANPEIEMLGIYDTVGSFGIPSDIAGIPFQQINLFTNLNVAPNVKHVTHLVAVHEGRNTFKPTLCNVRQGVEEVWFPGVHSDVGGGYADRGLSDIALDFMVRRFKEKGIRFKDELLKGMKPNLTGLIHDKVKEEYKLKLVHRKIVVLKKGKPSSESPKIHESVWKRYERFGERVPAHLKKVENNFLAVHTPETSQVENMA